MTEYTLKYGEQSVSFSLPESVQIDVLFPNKELDALTDPANEIKESLRRPIGTYSLRELIAKEKPKNVVVLVSDLTRPCPSHVIVPPLIDELLNTGLREDQIKIIFGLGFTEK